jgi:acyl-Coa thioesterase superfamily protein/acyl-CoA thioesterase superfamily protein
LSFYEPLGGGRYRATPHTRGPWDPRAQHAGPPSALLGGALEATRPRDDLVVARVTVEILGPVPVAEVELETAVTRPGRSVELVEGELRAGGRAALRARLWRVLPAPVGAGEPGTPPPLPPSGEPVPALWKDFGYGDAIEWRYARGGWTELGPAAVWTRLRVPVVAEAAPTPLQRVLAVADSGSGVSAALAWDRHVFINCELTVHVLRGARGEWICLDAATDVAAGGAGLAHSVLSDAEGTVARGAQSLLVTAR